MALAHSAPRLVERSEELGRCVAALPRLRDSEGGLLVLEGPAGIGKTRLLDEVRAEAERQRVSVLRARGGELERDFAYGIARQLFERPVWGASDLERGAMLAGAARLAGPVVGVPAADGGGTAIDAAFAVIHGLYWLTSNLATEGPLMLEIDDLHWADEESLRFLLYLVQRLDGLPVLVAVGARPGEPGVSEDLLAKITSHDRAERLCPSPLSECGVAEVLRERYATDPAPEFANAAHEVTGGNPFLLAELLEALLSDGVDPVAASAERVRHLGPETVARSVFLRLARLPPPAADLARTVAMLGSQAELRHAATLIGASLEETARAADALAAVNILDPGTPLRFVHPVLREAVYADMHPPERSKRHENAARVLNDAGARPSAISTHVLAVEPRGDDGWAVDLLRQTASSSLEQGAADNARRCLRRALADMPADHPDRADVVADLGVAEFLAGDPMAAMTHLQASVEATEDPNLRALRAVTLSRTRFSMGDIRAAFDGLEAELPHLAGAADEVTKRVEAELGSIGLMHPPTAPRAAERIERFVGIEGATPGTLLLIGNLASWHWLHGTADDAGRLASQSLADGQKIASEGAESIPVYQSAWVLAYADRADEALTTLDAAVARARAMGSAFGYGMACALRAVVDWRCGDLVACIADARSGAELDDALPHFARPSLYAYLAVALAERGEIDAAERAIEESGVGPGLDELVTHNPAFYCRGVVRLAQGRYEDALADFTEMGARDDRLTIRNPGVSWRCGAAFALMALDRRDEARELVAGHMEAAQRWGTASSIGIGLHARGLVDRDPDALREAVATLEGSPARLDHARALVDLGAALRRAGHRRDAHDPLRDGLEAARRCGATVLVERAHAELVTAGARPRRLQFSGAESLTASERRVADMAAAGESNKEIAQALFITPKTVENHLSRVYSKLAISSRAQLGDALAAGD